MCLERRGKNRIIDAERTTTKSGRIFRVELKDKYAFFIFIFFQRNVKIFVQAGCAYFCT